MKRKLWIIPLIALLCALLLAGCTVNGVDPVGPDQPDDPTDTTPSATLSEESLALTVLAEYKLEATLENIEDATSVIWTTSDESVLTVEGNGDYAILHAVGVGSATVSVSIEGEEVTTVLDSCEVTVTESPLTIFLPSSGLILKKGVSATVKAICSVELTGEITWESSDESIGSVEWQGLTARVTAVARGTCTIYVHADGYTASFTFTVGIS